MQNRDDMRNQDGNNTRLEVDLRGTKVRAVRIDDNCYAYSKEDIERAFGRTIDVEALPIKYMDSPCPMFSFEKMKPGLEKDEIMDMMEIGTIERSRKRKRMHAAENTPEGVGYKKKRRSKNERGGEKREDKDKTKENKKEKGKEKEKPSERKEEEEKEKEKEKEKENDRKKVKKGKRKGKEKERQVGREDDEEGAEEEESGRGYAEDEIEGERETKATRKKVTKKKRVTSVYTPDDIDERCMELKRRLTWKSKKLRQVKKDLQRSEQWCSHLERMLDESMKRNLRSLDVFVDDWVKNMKEEQYRNDDDDHVGNEGVIKDDDNDRDDEKEI